MINTFCFPVVFHISFVQLQSIQCQLGELEEYLVDCQHEKQTGDFLESNVLEQYLSNMLWPDQTKTNNFHSNDIWGKSFIDTSFQICFLIHILFTFVNINIRSTLEDMAIQIIISGSNLVLHSKLTFGGAVTGSVE